MQKKLLLTLCATGIALGLVVAWNWPATDAPASATVAEPKKNLWQSLSHLGTNIGRDPSAVSYAGMDFEEVPDGMVRVDDRGRLITDVQLHNAMDSYLLHTDVVSRQAAAEQLRAYLARKLPPAVRADGEALVTQYLHYIDEHDSALARLRLAVPSKDSAPFQGLEPFAAWLEQRRTLRLTALGPALYKEWFAAEDQRCASLLTMAPPANGVAAPAPEPAPNPIRGESYVPMPAAGPQWQDALDCAAELSRSYTVQETEGRQWTRHLNQYRTALAQLQEKDPGRRAQQMAALRGQIFTTPAERERAAAMPLP